MTDSIEIQEIEIPMDAGRVCAAISKIGYVPHSALMDIVDNAVTAEATRIDIYIYWGREGASFIQSKDNVNAYYIVDNGKGMDEKTILTALQLGSNVVSYGDKSLSKYGMGLKSAGLSLGKKIEVFSKQKGQWTKPATLDVKRIEKTGKWVIQLRDYVDGEKRHLDTLLKADSGTVIKISECRNSNPDSTNSIVKTLNKKLGMVYFYFLQRSNNPLQLSILTQQGETSNYQFDLLPRAKSASIQPHNMMFEHLAKIEAFNPDTYDYISPYKVISGKEIMVSDDLPPILLDVVLFPRARMATFPDFDERERKQIKSYDVTRNNKGFFIFRNERLIRWGEIPINSEGENIINKDAWGFRARLRFETAHDDILHVDVSKQRLNIPADIVDDLQRFTKTAVRDSVEIIKLCSVKYKNNEQQDGYEFNKTNDDLESENPNITTSGEQAKNIPERREKIEKNTREEMKADGEPPVVEDMSAPFEKVRYSDKMPTSIVYAAHSDPVGGEFVRINKNHPFYTEVLSQLSPASPERQMAEALFWCMAVAEVKSEESSALDQALFHSLFMHYKKLFTSNLDNWVSKNSTILD